MYIIDWLKNKKKVLEDNIFKIKTNKQRKGMSDYQIDAHLHVQPSHGDR